MIQLVEEVMRRMREIYGTDREIGDMSLGSITQFVYRKLRLVHAGLAVSPARQ